MSDFTKLQDLIEQAMRDSQPLIESATAESKLLLNTVVGKITKNLDVVDRQDFEALERTLARCQQKLETLEARLDELENNN